MTHDDVSAAAIPHSPQRRAAKAVTFSSQVVTSKYRGITSVNDWRFAGLVRKLLFKCGFSEFNFGALEID